MSKSEYVRVEDVSAILAIVGEAFELPDDPILRGQHIVNRSCQFFGARSGMVAIINPAPAEGKPNIEFGAAGGWLDESSIRLYEKYANDAHMRDPMLMNLLENHKTRGVFQRNQIIGNSAWYGSFHFNEMRIPLGIDDSIYAFYPIAEQGHTTGIGINRALGEKPFTKREYKLAVVLHQALIPFYQYLKAKNLATNADDFSPMSRRVLQLLLTGRTEKQIAAHVKRSIHTIHDHVKHIYKKTGVSSRAELLARFLAPKPPSPTGK